MHTCLHAYKREFSKKSKLLQLKFVNWFLSEKITLKFSLAVHETWTLFKEAKKNLTVRLLLLLLLLHKQAYMNACTCTRVTNTGDEIWICMLEWIMVNSTTRHVYALYRVLNLRKNAWMCVYIYILQHTRRTVLHACKHRCLHIQEKIIVAVAFQRNTISWRNLFYITSLYRGYVLLL